LSVVCLAIVPALVYYAAFAIHFSLLWKTGQGDAFMSPEFQHDLEGSTYANDQTLQPLSMADKFLQLNMEMYRSNQRLTATHPYSSKWYTWPLMVRSIFYWVKGDARIYLIGNPVVWWGSTVALLAALVLIIRRRVIHAPGTLLVMAGAWVMNLLPFIGISRVMFLYHYSIALIWAVLMLAWFADRWQKPERTVLASVAIALVAFAFFAPLSYGLALSPQALDWRMWLTSWK
jgi:dolichyl-phosphate-mannose-protein mannosyltransferase